MFLKEGKTVFDWDGTLKKIDGAVAQTFIDPYVAELAKRIRINESELAERMQKTLAVVISHPENYGWDIGEERVSFATDTYLATQAAANEILKNMKIVPAPDLLNQVFKHSRRLMDLVFQPGAGEFIEKMKQEGGAVIVTNSDTADVVNELKELMGSQSGVEVKGNAKKFVVDSNWEGWRKVMNYSWVRPGDYPRGMSLKRPHYVEVLSGLGEIKWVIGDLAMDLWVPGAMGITTALKTTDYTPRWEINYFDSQNSNRFLIEDYTQSLAP